MKKKVKPSLFRAVVTLPAIIYCLGLVLLPILYVFFLSFLTSDSYGGYTYDFTFNNYIEIFEPTYIVMFLKSSAIALLVTFLTLLISYPFAIFLMDKTEKKQNFLIKLVMIPFLTNSLIRTFGWVILLRKNGLINTGLMSTGLISSPLSLMYNTFGIVIGLTYTLLPFMILPVYSAVSKVDRNLISAAKDLGASKWKVFKEVYLPLTLSGAFNGSLMVFIPAIGYFFIADILGGGKVMIIGDLIRNQFLSARNWPFGAALSIFLLLFTFLLLRIYRKIGGRLDELGGGI